METNTEDTIKAGAPGNTVNEIEDVEGYGLGVQAGGAQKGPQADAEAQNFSRAVRPVVQLGHIPRWLYIWVPIVTSVASLIIALFSMAVATSDPEVMMITPQWVRLSQGYPDGSVLFSAQPSFVSTGKNDRVEVILDMRLRVTRLGDGETRELHWLEQGRWEPGTDGAGLGYKYVADAGPLLVSPNNPQLPVAVFTSDPPWKFTAGTYRITIVAQRAVTRSPLEGTFTVTLTEDQVKFLSDNLGRYSMPLATSK
jgi:hypothetical protein